MLSRRTLLALTALTTLGAAVAWPHRREILEALAPPESDYVETQRLAAGYGRASADLSAAWSVPLEPGYGGAEVFDRKAFVLDREIGVGDTLRVIDVLNGAVLWTFSYPEPGRLQSAGSRTAPAVNDRFVFLCSGFGTVHCVDRASRTARWKRHLVDDLGGSIPDFGYSADPLLHGELVILPALGEEVGLVALDQVTGELRWRTPPLGTSQSQPVLIPILGEELLLFLSCDAQGAGENRPAPVLVSALRPSTGELRWQHETMLTNVPVPPPVAVDGSRFVITGGYAGGTTLLRVERTGAAAYGITEEFHLEKGSQLHPPVVVGKHIYLLANENTNISRLRRGEGGLRCYTLEGEELWSTGRDPYFARGHMIPVGPYLLIQDGMSGILRLCAATPDGYQQVVTANVFKSPPKERKRMWGKIAGWNGTLVLRGDRELVGVFLGGTPPGARQPTRIPEAPGGEAPTGPR
jgi:outer membrane protein assembly factor BamB